MNCEQHSDKSASQMKRVHDIYDSCTARAFIGKTCLRSRRWPFIHQSDAWGIMLRTTSDSKEIHVKNELSDLNNLTPQYVKRGTIQV